MYLGPINAEWVLLIVIAIVGFIVQAKLQSVFKKYSKVMFPGGLTGKDVAERMLHDNGIYDVKVVSTPGHLTDHYNPATKTVNLSESVYSSNSVAAAAVAAHECGHAVQHAREYAPLKMRSALVPVVSFSSQWAMWVIIAGMLLLNTYPALFWIGIGMIAVSAVFSLITLPGRVQCFGSRDGMADRQLHVEGRTGRAGERGVGMGGAHLFGRGSVGGRDADLLYRDRPKAVRFSIA